jgi:hypothetical protein
LGEKEQLYRKVAHFQLIYKSYTVLHTKQGRFGLFSKNSESQVFGNTVSYFYLRKVSRKFEVIVLLSTSRVLE